jgi:hypothetical protein
MSHIDIWTGGPDDMHLSAHWLPSAERPSVLMEETFRDRYTLMLSTFDGALSRSNVVATGMLPAPWPYDRSEFAPDGSMLISPRKYAAGTALDIVAFFDRVVTGSVSFAVPSDHTLSVSFVPGTRVALVAVEHPRRADRSGRLEVAVLDTGPLVAAIKSAKGAKVGAADALRVRRDLATAAIPSSDVHSTVAPLADGSALLYVTAKGQLRAVPLDGGQDVLLSAGVSAVWSLASQPDLSWSR